MAGKLRVVPLQEAHLDDLVAIEATKDRGARVLQEVARLPRQHNVRVATVDDVPRGYLAWRDEAPGVGVLEELVVHREHRRTGIATALLATMREEAKRIGVTQIVVRAPSDALPFLKKNGFSAIDSSSPERVDGWRAAQTEDGKPLVEGGAEAMWSDV